MQARGAAGVDGLPALRSAGHGYLQQLRRELEPRLEDLSHVWASRVRVARQAAISTRAATMA